MKEDFALAKEELARIGIVRVTTDFYITPKRRGAIFFVKSPATHDKTWSCALYPGSNRFCDFANANISGDCIAFVAYIRGSNQWEALHMLKDFYGLSGCRERSGEGAKRKIMLQQEQECKRKERRHKFEAALLAQIDNLKRWRAIYRMAIEKCLYEPFSDMWAYCVNELQRTEYKLDILTGADCREYPRLKAHSENLPSDRFEWLLDCLAVLADSGMFTATAEELKEIKAQAAFEIQRKPGTAVRRCGVDW